MNAKENAFIASALQEVGVDTEVPAVIFSPGTIAYTGTTAEAGDPVSVSFSTRTANARVQSGSQKEIERSSGKYFQDDQTISIRGSFSKDDSIAISTGTYRPVAGPYKYYMGADLYWQAVCRK